MVLCIKQSHFGRKTMEKNIGETTGDPPNDSDDGALWVSSDDEFERSSSPSSSVMGESSKQVAGTSSSSTAKPTCDPDSDGSDSSLSSEGRDHVDANTAQAKKLVASIWSRIVPKTVTIEDALDTIPMNECIVAPSRLEEGGDGLFAPKMAPLGTVMAVLSMPSSQHAIANGLPAPAGCVQVHTGPCESIYQTWQRKRGQTRRNGGFANAPKRGKNGDENCIIYRVSKLHGTTRKYATVLVSIRKIAKNEEIYARYDNTYNNREFFEADKQASSSKKQVDEVDKADVGFPGAPKAVKRKKSTLKLESGDAVASWSDALNEYAEQYMIKMQEERNDGTYTTLYRCQLKSGVKRFMNGKAHELQQVTIPPSTKMRQVRFSMDMAKLIEFCESEQVFFWPKADPGWFLAKKIPGNWKIVQEVELSIVEVKRCWLNNLISLFGVGAPWNHKFGFLFNLFLHECAQMFKHKRYRKRSDFYCINFMPPCVLRSAIVENTFHPSGFMPQSILQFLGQDEVTGKLLNHAFEKCICYGVTEKPGGCCWYINL